MSIDENGFLDADAVTWITKHRNDHSALFSVCESINYLSQTHLYRLNIHSEDVQELVVSLLFIRALGAFQTSILLIERGLTSEARIILRNLIEILFKLRAVSRDRDVARAYVYADEIDRKKFINKFRLLSDDLRQAHGNPKLDELLQAIKENIDVKDITERQTQWYAQKAGLSDYYNTVYSIFSRSVHVNVRELEELLVTDGEGHITEITYGPDAAKGLDRLLLTGGETQCLILEDISRVFALKVEDRVRGVAFKAQSANGQARSAQLTGFERRESDIAEIISRSTLVGLPDAESLSAVGTLIDYAADKADLALNAKAMTWCQELESRSLSARSALCSTTFVQTRGRTANRRCTSQALMSGAGIKTRCRSRSFFFVVRLRVPHSANFTLCRNVKYLPTSLTS